MKVEKIRFIEPGERPYHWTLLNHFVYDRYIRTPSVGLNLLATAVKGEFKDTLMYSEAISKIPWKDVEDADVVFIGIFTFQAKRGYQIARYIKAHTRAVVVMGGLHASMNYQEAVNYCDYVLLGEGEESILELLHGLREGLPLNFPGLAYRKGGKTVVTGKRRPPETIDIIPDRSLVYKYRNRVHYNTIWPQVHASRGCPHHCDYCALVRHFGREVRTRTPENVVEDIRRAIAFFRSGPFPRLLKGVWLTDDNFFADREWTLEVLQKIIDSDICWPLTVQARYEVGFDDEMLSLLKRAGFFELALGIEFVDDEDFKLYHKKSRVDEIKAAIKNIQSHGLSVRGLFILGADNHREGIGDKLADFVIENHIQGVLIQSMYFVPGTPVYEQNKGRLLHRDWSKYNGNVVHYPKNISPYKLQQEHIRASKRIYSPGRLLRSLLTDDPLHKMLFFGEMLWHGSICLDLKRELPYLKKRSQAADCQP
ncbi:MAG: B12-binding domain-containing radical SAM protein [Lachnospiraceae bacterium]|nr:B12-binding domain-containing radical SAM protein [Lachnospiraceae bacterium]